MTNKNRVGFFGGVQDNEDAESEDSDDEDGTAGNFFNDLLSVNIENERATWTKIELTGKKDGAVKKRKKDGSPNDGVIFHVFLFFFTTVLNFINQSKVHSFSKQCLHDIHFMKTTFHQTFLS